MTRLSLVALLLAGCNQGPAFAGVQGTKVLAATASGTTVSVNGGTLVREGRAWILHPGKQAKKTGSAIKKAVKGH